MGSLRQGGVEIWNRHVREVFVLEDGVSNFSYD
jgi:hypothetical protein